VGFLFNTQTEGSHKHRKIALLQTQPPLSTRVEISAAMPVAMIFNLHYAIGQELQATM